MSFVGCWCFRLAVVVYVMFCFAGLVLRLYVCYDVVLLVICVCVGWVFCCWLVGFGVGIRDRVGWFCFVVCCAFGLKRCFMFCFVVIVIGLCVDFAAYLLGSRALVLWDFVGFVLLFYYGFSLLLIARFRCCPKVETLLLWCFVDLFWWFAAFVVYFGFGVCQFMKFLILGECCAWLLFGDLCCV